jgi:hypothetical protein
LRTACAVAGVILSVGLTSANADSISISLIASEEIVNPGDTIQVDIFATTETTSLVGYGFDLTSDDNLSFLSFDAYAVAPAFEQTITPDGDGLGGLSFTGGINGVNVLIGTAQFSALAIGQAAINLTTTAGDLTEGFAQAGNGFFDVFANTLLINVTQAAGGGGGGTNEDPGIPEPATAILMAVGLTTLIRKRL